MYKGKITILLLGTVFLFAFPLVCDATLMELPGNHAVVGCKPSDPTLNIDTASNYIMNNSSSDYTGHCSDYVLAALKEGGITVTRLDTGESGAKDYGKHLEKAGFVPTQTTVNVLDKDGKWENGDWKNFEFKPGDVVIFDKWSGYDTEGVWHDHPNGHMEYDVGYSSGTEHGWYSDTRQMKYARSADPTGFLPSHNPAPKSFRVYRMPQVYHGTVENRDPTSWSGSWAPEPATICLLGLGGLAMLRRRRGSYQRTACSG
jgi:hypothetical protein